METYHFLRHLNLVNKHRWFVFCNSIKLGIPLRGFLHDLSKYSPKEFITSAKYYKGTSSPVLEERKNNNMYSTVCVHHVKKNKHHFEYRIDYYRGGLVLIAMPYKYALEYVADVIAASKAYNGKNYSNEMPYNYFVARKEKYLMHNATKEFITICLYIYKKEGFAGLKKSITKKLYNECLSHYKVTEIIQLN